VSNVAGQLNLTGVVLSYSQNIPKIYGSHTTAAIENTTAGNSGPKPALG
jgi:hypothetical protein